MARLVVSPMTLGGLVFAVVFGGALFGMLLQSALPANHLSEESREVMKLAVGIIATTAALVLGLLIASAKGSYDTQNNEVKQSAANVVLLDRTLAHYGPETAETRELLRRAVAVNLAATWPERGSRPVRVGIVAETPPIEVIEDKIRELSPQGDRQRWLQSRALQISGDLHQTRWLLLGTSGGSIPMPFFVVLVFWVTIIFAILGLFAPRNATVAMVLLACALSISSAMFLILEMDRPFEGMMKISSAPVRYALAHLGR